MGARYEYIKSSSTGFYKQYSIHPVNFDTLAVYTNYTDRTVLRSLPLFGMGVSRTTGKRGSIYANITQNYRAINFTDIRVTNPNFQVDSLIRDEYGFTSELGFRGLVMKYLIYDIAAFYLFYGDKIGLAPKPGTIYKERTNIGDAHNYGLEVFTEFDLLKGLNDSTENGLSLFLNAAYTNATYIRSKEPSYVGKKVEYVSSFIVKSGLKYKFKGLTIQTQGSFNSKQFTDATNSVEPSGDAVIGEIPAYLVFDLSARYKFRKHFSLELGVNNFTNQKYFTRRATSYPGPGIIPSDGINGYLTVQYNFSL
jgi:Fe(3+) dicitrate transport protein